MTTIEFLSYLRSLDIKVWAEGNKLRYRARESDLSPSLRVELAQRKSDLLRVLSELGVNGRSDRPPLRPVDRGIELPLSFSQQRLWLLNRLQPGNAYYNECSAAR